MSLASTVTRVPNRSRDEAAGGTKGSSGELKQKLVAAALSALRETDAEELSLREVARRAGVSHNAPYHHYSGGKAELFADVAAEGFRRLRKDFLPEPSAANSRRRSGCRRWRRPMFDSPSTTGR
jgi:AcrR family transcriptional regulator